MNQWVNFGLLANPMNWLIVALTLILVAYGLFIAHSNLGALTPALTVKQGN